MKSTTSPAIGTSRTSSQLRAIALCGVLAVIATIITGLTADFDTNHWLGTVIATSLALWVGGAASGQIILARLLDGPHPGDVTRYTRQLLWLIPLVFVPLGVFAVAAGCYLVVTGPAMFTDPAVYIPLALYLITTIAGSAISAPGYIRLLRRIEHNDDIAAPANRTTLLKLAWLNRTELILVVGVAFPLLVSFA